MNKLDVIIWKFTRLPLLSVLFCKIVDINHINNKTVYVYQPRFHRK